MVQTSSIVPFSLDTVGKCKCPVCPVQAESSCVAGKKQNLSAALGKTPLNKEDIPGAYCGSGTATCTDLDQGKGCICGTCSVYNQYELRKGKPGGRFCKNGMAK